MKAKTSKGLAATGLAAVFALTAWNVAANEINLTTSSSGSFTGGTYPGSASDGAPPDAVYTTIDTLPAGTGVFDPFLTYQHRDTEQGVNTSSGGNGQGFLDDKRVPQWTHNLHVGDLAVITRNGQTYYGFELDANETGSGSVNRLLSIDDIRIFTSHTDTLAGLNNDTQVLGAISGGTIGTLRYAQNATFGGTANWVLIDASRSEGGSTSGSGSSDMLVLIPTGVFGDALSTDLLYFYTANGFHDGVGGDDGSDAGYEEWRAVVGVPDGGSTLILLGSVLTGLGYIARRKAQYLA